MALHFHQNAAGEVETVQDPSDDLPASTITMADVPEILAERARIMGEIKERDAYAKMLSQAIEACLVAHGLERYDDDDYTVKWIQNTDKETVDPVKLGLKGVDVQIIRDCTTIVPGARYFRIDTKKKG